MGSRFDADQDWNDASYRQVSQRPGFHGRSSNSPPDNEPVRVNIRRFRRRALDGMECGVGSVIDEQVTCS
jgi:hypothetical protein